MMCADCKVAGQFNLRGQYDKAEEMHRYCKGDCTCQHKTGLGWFVREGQKATLTQIQSP